jgi:hypothetical protein
VGVVVGGGDVVVFVVGGVVGGVVAVVAVVVLVVVVAVVVVAVVVVAVVVVVTMMIMTTMVVVVMDGRGRPTIYSGLQTTVQYSSVILSFTLSISTKDKGTYEEKSILNLTSLKPETLGTKGTQHIARRQGPQSKRCETRERNYGCQITNSSCHYRKLTSLIN